MTGEYEHDPTPTVVVDRDSESTARANSVLLRRYRTSIDGLGDARPLPLPSFGALKLHIQRAEFDRPGCRYLRTSCNSR